MNNQTYTYEGGDTNRSGPTEDPCPVVPHNPMRYPPRYVRSLHGRMSHLAPAEPADISGRQDDFVVEKLDEMIDYYTTESIHVNKQLAYWLGRKLGLNDVDGEE